MFPVLAHTRAIIENAFFDAFFHEQLVIGVCEPMCLVADALKQTQRTGIHWKSQRQRAARSIDLLAFLRQADNRKIVQTQSLQLSARSGELAFAAIDNDQIRKANGDKTFVIARGAQRSRGTPLRYLCVLQRGPSTSLGMTGNSLHRVNSILL